MGTSYGTWAIKLCPVVLLLCLAGCTALNPANPLTPERNHILTGNPPADFTTLTDIYWGVPTNYNITPQQARNLILKKLMFLADQNFMKYSINLNTGKGISDTASDVVFLGISAAATATTSAQAGRILSGIAAVLAGANASVEKNLFLEKTIPALISEMETQRALVETDIIRNLDYSVERYSLIDALRDFLRYYKAGTLTYAARSLTQAADERNTQAQIQLGRSSLEYLSAGGQTFAKIPPPIVRPGGPIHRRLPADLQTRTKALQEKYAALTPDQATIIVTKFLSARGYPEKEPATEKVARAILEDAQQSVPSGETPSDVLKQYRVSQVTTPEAMTEFEKIYAKYWAALPLPAPPPSAATPSGAPDIIPLVQ